MVLINLSKNPYVFLFEMSSKCCFKYVYKISKEDIKNSSSYGPLWKSMFREKHVWSLKTRDVQNALEKVQNETEKGFVCIPKTICLIF